MPERPLAQRFFESAGINVRETPTTTTVGCLLGIRDSIQFNPANPESVKWARETALRQIVRPPRLCGEACPTAPIPCSMRMLEDGTYNYLMRVFKK